MKGFPNQIADLPKLTAAFRLFVRLLSADQNPKDDEVYGEALLRAGLLRTGHTPIPLEEYLKLQRRKTPSNRSYRTSARGLRELFRILGLIDETRESIAVTVKGEKVSQIERSELNKTDLELWRVIIRDMDHDGGDGEFSHPYLVLLRLIARKPGITRAKCALALEARNDTEEELDRIEVLADLEEEGIAAQIGTTPTNWDNAKKILPSFAEQLGDVNKVGQSYYLADAPGIKEPPFGEDRGQKRRNGVRTPRSSREVTADNIATGPGSQESDEADDKDVTNMPDAETLGLRKARLRARVARHNDIVRRLARGLEREGATLYEDPFDCLACFEEEGILIEVKSLEGTEADEITRVREALAQLLYYEAFVIEPLSRGRRVVKVACFEDMISERHIEWLRQSNISVIWCVEDGFDSDETSRRVLEGHFGF